MHVFACAFFVRASIFFESHIHVSEMILDLICSPSSWQPDVVYSCWPADAFLLITVEKSVHLNNYNPPVSSKPAWSFCSDLSRQQGDSCV